MKRFISIIISIAMILSVIPCVAQGEEETMIPLSELNEEIVKFVEVQEQDVEVYVTDGYNPIPNAEVKVNNETKITNTKGLALFKKVIAKDDLYDVFVQSDAFGEHQSQVFVSDKIIEGTSAKIQFTVSYWKENCNNTLMSNKQQIVSSQYEDNNIYKNDNSNNSTLGTIGEWIQGSSMHINRSDATATLYNGKIYIIGGSVGKENTNTVEIYDISTNCWYQGSSMKYERIRHTATLYNGKIYVIGGYYSRNSIEVYDIQTNTWIELESLPVGKYRHTATLYNNKIYAVAGDYKKENSLEIYDLKTQTWSIGNDMNIGSIGHQTILYDNKLYVIGGFNGNNSRADKQLDIYDLTTDKWTLGKSMPVNRGYYFDTILYNDKIYVLGGAGYDALKSMDIYNIKDGTWSTGANMENCRNGLTASLYKNKIYVIGGVDENMNVLNTMEVFDITNNIWTTSNKLKNNPTTGHSTIEYNGKLYVIGGEYLYNNPLNDLEIFTIEDLPDIIYNEISSVTTTPSSIEVDYNTPAENLDALLPTQAKVTLDNGSDDDFDIIEWDKSEYKADTPGEYTVYGTIDLPDGIINPQGKKAEAKVKVGEPPRPTTHPIEIIEPIQITANQSVPLEQEGLEHALGVPVTVSLPKTVEAILDDGTTAELNVTLWHIDSYNPHQTGKQTILGDVELKDGIENPKNLPATLEITVIPTEYEIVEASPQKISVDVLAGTPKDKILEKIEQKTIDVDVLNAETNEEIYIYTGFTLNDEYAENLAYNPNQLGKQTLIGRFYSNFLDTIEPPCVEVEVNVVSSEIASVTEEHVNAYQCKPFDSIENLPQKVTVNLENGMTEKVDVEWNSGNYEKCLAGDQIITGNLVNLPTGVIQPEEEKTAVLIVHVQPVSYKVTAITPDEDFFETDKDGNELYAGFTLAELREKLPVDKVKVQMTSVTENVNISTEYELDFTLEEENNTVYTSEDEFLDNLYGTLVLPENITNPDNLMYEFMVKTNAVEITEIEPVSVIVDYYTEFNDIDLPDTVYANLSNGQRKPIGVTWNSDGYNPDSDELTEDNPVVFNLSGTLCDVPLYINHYDKDVPQLTITLVLPRVYKITGISPVRIPETGTKKINLGSSLSDIYDLIENHTVTVALENLKGVTSTQDLTFTLREEDNEHYDAMSEEEVELTAYLNLPEGIENPDNKQLVISVRPTKYTIRTTVASRVNGIVKGTPFAEIAMPEKVTVNYTDTETKQGEVPVASWDGSKYNPEKIGNQAIKGTFPDPLPVYVTNPNNRTPSAIVNVVDPTTTILSAKQVTGAAPFSAMRRSIRKAITQTEEIDGYIERKYEVELLHEDGTITTEIISIFDEVEEN